LNRPAPPYTAPIPTALPYPTAAPLCGSDQVRATGAAVGAAAGNIRERFTFTNTSHSTCLLRGSPTITGIAPGGRRRVLHPRPSPATFFGLLVPADIPPGHRVYLDLATQDVTCSVTHPLVYRDLAFGLPGDMTLRSRARLRRFCGGWEMSRFGRPPRTTASIRPRPGSLDTLRVSVTLPASARAGTTLRYVVTLINPTLHTVRLACPSYTEAISTPELHRSLSYLLNCGTVHAIEPHQRIRYQMQLAIPDTPPGWAKLAWHLNTPREPEAGTALAIRGR
jgi:Domain of unknown function (DUF4232)